MYPRYREVILTQLQEHTTQLNEAMLHPSSTCTIITFTKSSSTVRLQLATLEQNGTEDLFKRFSAVPKTKLFFFSLHFDRLPPGAGGKQVSQQPKPFLYKRTKPRLTALNRF